MQRTPQATLTQTKLTGYGVTQGTNSSALQAAVSASADRLTSGCTAANVAGQPPRGTDSTTVAMDTSVAPPPVPANSTSFITTDFLLKALRENTDHIVKSFNAHVSDLSMRVDGNAAAITENRQAIATNTGDTARCRADLDRLEKRVRAIEKGSSDVRCQTTKAVLSAEYLLARRSVRLWPVPGDNEEDMWVAVGDFLHDTLRVSTHELCQEDVERVDRIESGGLSTSNVKDEVLVRFKDAKKRDIVVVSSVNLAGMVDETGKPTAGIRLEIPQELVDTFRLLSRFGTRLRARHGEGTKRHIKFDDFAGSLVANIKLPGDVAWTRVTAEMAKKDLEDSLSEERAANQKRLASKLIPGPRERLNRPVDMLIERARVGPQPSAPPGKRPRWSGPPRRP